MRLGVSPAAALTPTGIFYQRSEALFPGTGALGYRICFTPLCSSWSICERVWGRGVLSTVLPAPFSATLSLALSVSLCANVGPQGLLVVRLPAPLVPHSASLGPATATRVLSAPMPVSAPPTSLDECLFFISLVSDFLAVRFSVSSGCARRLSVSTYAAILVFKPIICSNKFSISCFFSFPSGTPMIWMLGHLKMSWRILSLFSFFRILVSPFCSG